MYADTGLLYPYWPSFSSDFQQLEEYCKFEKTSTPLGNLDPCCVLSDYDLGNDGDLFKAPEAFIEEPELNLDPVAVSMPMISCGEDVGITQGLDVPEMEPLHNIDSLFNEVYNECKMDMLGKTVFDEGFEEVLDFKISPLNADENCIPEDKVLPDLARTKSVSSECLSSMEWMQASTMTPSFLDFPSVDYEIVYGMRRAFSEGDIKERSLAGNGCTSEDRKEKLSRYRNKRSKRNFGRKIKYACRKALADSQPRIRGRFARTEETESSKGQ